MGYAIAAGIIFILILLAVVYFIPDEKKKAQKRREKELLAQKDWQKTALHLEGHIHHLRRELEALEKKDKDLVSALSVEKTKGAALQEKLVKERQWHHEEDEHILKFREEIQQLKKEMLKEQEVCALEHAKNLRLDQSLRELKQEKDSLADEKRTRDLELAQLKTRIDHYRQENIQLKADNAQLIKKKEDTAWVAKTEFDELQMKYKTLEKELERLKRQ